MDYQPDSNDMALDQYADLGWWFPRLKARSLGIFGRLPRTEIVRFEPNLVEVAKDIFDAHDVPAFQNMVTSIERAAAVIGYPCFLRSGFVSAKHDWERSCYLPDDENIAFHVYSIMEYSEMAGMFGELPYTTWAVRELIPTRPLFHAFWGNMPITREFRIFTGALSMEGIQPYWPPSSIIQPDQEDWRTTLKEASTITTWLATHLLIAGETVKQAVNHGEIDIDWSVDFLQDAHGAWWMTDMAPAALSYRWDPAWQQVGDRFVPTSDGDEAPEIDYSGLLVVDK